MPGSLQPANGAQTLDSDALPYAVILVVLTGITAGFAVAQPLAAVHTQGLHQSCNFWMFEETCTAVKTSSGYSQCKWNWDGEYGRCEFSSLCKDEFSIDGCQTKGCMWFEENDLSYCHAKVGWSSGRVGIFSAANVVGMLLGFCMAMRLELKMNVVEIVSDTLFMFVFLLGANGVSLYLFGFHGGSETDDAMFEIYCLTRTVVAFFVGFAGHLVPQLAARAFPPSLREEPKAILHCCAACSYAFSIGVVFALEGVVWIVGGLEVCCVASTTVCIAAMLILRSEFNSLARKPQANDDSGEDEIRPISLVIDNHSDPNSNNSSAPTAKRGTSLPIVTSILMSATSQSCGLMLYIFYMPTLSVFIGLREMTGSLLVAIANAVFTLCAVLLPPKYLPLHRLQSESRYVLSVAVICSLLLLFSFSLRSYQPGELFSGESLVVFLHVAAYHLLYLPAEALATKSMLTVGMRRKAQMLRNVLSGGFAALIVGMFPILTQQVSHMNESVRTLNPQGLQHSIADILCGFTLCGVLCAVTVSFAVRKSIFSHTGYKKALID
jgi:hypothetical protein